MKHIFLLISFFISLNMFAIDPQKGFNYQAVLRDASGMVIKEQSVTLQVTIMSDNQVAYKETHQLTTSATGYINMVIGNGSRVFGTFEKIDWSAQNQSIKIKLDRGNGYEEISATELGSVPYAKYAEYALNSNSEDFQKSIGALKKTNDSLVNCIIDLKKQLEANETSLSDLQDATASFSEYQELKDKKYTSILPPEGLGQDNIDVNLARKAVSAVLRFLTRMGILKYNCHNGYIASIIEEEDLVSVKASAPGFLRRFVTINEEVNRGQLLGEVINPYNGEILSEIRSTADGIIFYAEDQPTILENASAFQVIKKLHE